MDALIDFSSGIFGGIVNVYVGQPLDTVKVKMQTFPNLYRNSFHCAIKTFQVDGIYRGWYAGTTPALVAIVSTNAALFFSYGLCQKAVAKIVHKNDPKKLSPVEYGFAGAGAAVVAALVLCPAELVKCRIQAARELKKSINVGPYGLTKQIFIEKGFFGFYRGLSSLLVRDVPGYFVYFGAYELARELFTPAFQTKDQLGVVKTGIAGGIGGMASWCLVFPADVVKSRIQINSSGSDAKPSFMSALIKIVKTEGISKLYSGLGPTLVRTFFSTGALFITVEETSKLMRRNFIN